MLEKQIEKKVCDYAKTKKMLVYKFTSPQRRSVPDRIFITAQGFIFFIEFKAEGKKPTEAQTREHEKLRANNVKVFVVDSVPSGQFLIDSLYME